MTEWINFDRARPPYSEDLVVCFFPNRPLKKEEVCAYKLDEKMGTATIQGVPLEKSGATHWKPFFKGPKE